MSRLLLSYKAPPADKDGFELARQYGRLKGAAECVLEYLENPNSFFTREVLIRTLKAALTYDGSSSWLQGLTPPPAPTAHDRWKLRQEANHAHRTGEPWED